ncbi:MAG: hypothetical protein GY750_16355 [Lentisphaerae bacterium]|nr:hypothetical protein [Lentisphaerota bacterium]
MPRLTDRFESARRGLSPPSFMPCSASQNNELAAVEKWQNKRVNITFVFQNARKRSSGVAVSGYVKNGGKTIDITAELLLKYLNKLKNYKGGESVTVSGIMSKPTCAWYSYRSMFKVTLKDAKVIR